MGVFTPFVSSLALFAFFSCTLVQSLELEEIRAGYGGRGSRRLGKRDLSAFDMQSEETFLWAAADVSDVLLGNLTIYTPDSGENILNMEKFDGMLTTIICTPSSLTLTFDSDATFAYAQQVWDWVNGATNHSFLMVTGRDDCHPGARRTPYLVSAITYSEALNTAYLTAQIGNWTDLAHSYDLHVGHIPPQSAKLLGLARRDWNHDLSLSLDADFPFVGAVNAGPVSGSVVCDPCFTTGKMRFELAVQTKLFIPVGATFRLAPESVSAEAGIRLALSADLSDALTVLQPWTIAELSLGGISIPGGILTLGPVLDVQLGAEVGPFRGAVQVDTGASARLSDDARLQVNVLHPSENLFEAWTPLVSTNETRVSAKVSVAAQVYVTPALRVQVEALGHGIEAAIAMKMPYGEVRLEAISALDGSGACAPDDQFENAVRVSSSWGVEVKLRAGLIGQPEKGVDVTIASIPFAVVPPICYGFGPSSDDRGDGIPMNGTVVGPETGQQTSSIADSASQTAEPGAVSTTKI